MIVFSTQVHSAGLSGRVGVLLPEAQQRQSAVLAAPRGQDAPLAAETPAPEEDSPPKATEEPSALQVKSKEALAPVTLDDRIQIQALRGDLKQFGYDWFSTGTGTFSQVENMPVPADYVVSPGDRFVVQVFGATDVEYSLVVTREGRLLVPEVGDLSIAGLTFQEAKQVIQQAIDKVRIGVKTSVSLSGMNAIQVIMMGEFEKPGSYNVNGMATLFNALLSTGGVKKTGSLRNIQVRRQNIVIANMDLYDVLLKGQSQNNIFLRHGDVIFVPPIGPTVGVAGEVTRPAIYELKSEKTVNDAITLAGGLLPTASRNKPQIRRITENNGYTLVQADLSKNGGQTALRNGDNLRIYPVSSNVDNVVLLSGNVSYPGGYQWKTGMRITDLITSVEDLRLRTEFDVAVLVREKRFSRRIEVTYVNLGQALQLPASEHNIELRPRDELLIFETNSPRDNQLADTVRQLRAQATVVDPAQTIELKGFFLNPGVYPVQSGMRVLDIVKVSGGLQNETDLQYALLVRSTTGGRLEIIQVKLKEALANPIGDNNPVIQAKDRLYVFDDQMDRAGMLRAEVDQLKKQARYGEVTPLVQISGKVSRPGTYPQLPGMRVKDLLIASGGLLEEAYGLSASVSRKTLMVSEQSRQDHIELNLLGSQDLLQDTTMVLQAGDHLVIREKPEYINTPRMITLEGEVRFPGTYPIDRRETLCGVVRRAGGFTRDAYLFGTIFTRESVRAKEQAAIGKLFDQFDTLLAEVRTSSTFDNDKKLPVNNHANDVFNVIKTLKPPKATGRMVIDAKAAAEKCNEEADLVLESGDRIIVPKISDEVTVVGQVYQPTSHKYRSDRAALDYINLSGGAKELAVREHAFVIQANGEVMSVRSSMSSWMWLLGPSNVKVTPGATVVVPLSVDRINGREYTQTWIDAFYKAAVGAAGLAFLFK